MEKSTEVQNENLVNGKKRSRSSDKICEFMTYSGREAFKRLRTNTFLALSGDEKKCSVIGITSAQVSEGKSTVSINLAYSMAELGKRVLLIDCDLRRPSVHEKIGIPLAPGLSDVIFGVQELSKTIRSYRSTADDTRFDLITSGDIPDNPSELLNSERFQRIITALSGAYDVIIADLPPVNVVVDAVNVSRCTDGMIVVVRENHCPRFVLTDCVEQLRYAKANILGFVMNGCVEGSGKRYQYSQKYGQYYQQYTK